MNIFISLRVILFQLADKVCFWSIVLYEIKKDVNVTIYLKFFHVILVSPTYSLSMKKYTNLFRHCRIILMEEVSVRFFEQNQFLSMKTNRHKTKSQHSKLIYFYMHNSGNIFLPSQYKPYLKITFDYI